VCFRPDEVNDFFFNLLPALGFTQPVTEMSTRNKGKIKRGRRVRLTTSPPSMS
jgi:hypothetical protein